MNFFVYITAPLVALLLPLALTLISSELREIIMFTIASVRFD